MESNHGADQLSLFPHLAAVPERFRLDEATRRRGLRHVARLRAQLEARFPPKPAARAPVRTTRTAA